MMHLQLQELYTKFIEKAWNGDLFKKLQSDMVCVGNAGVISYTKNWNNSRSSLFPY